MIAATERSRTFQKITFTINRAAIVEPNPIEKNQRKLAELDQVMLLAGAAPSWGARFASTSGGVKKC
jgi:hypothetical protein